MCDMYIYVLLESIVVHSFETYADIRAPSYYKDRLSKYEDFTL